jgi:spermidine/putrescine transport system substrate-binding protein
VPWDKKRSHAVPWQSGLTGLAYNAKVTKEVRTFDELITRSDLKGKVTALSEMRDTTALALLSDGKKPDDFTDADFDAAIGRVQKGVDKKQIRRFTGNDYTSDLDKGDLAACLAWAGDVIQLQADNPDIKFAIPAAGYITSTDNLLVPAQARHQKNATRLIDYYYELPVAAQLAAYINYVCPVEGVAAELTKIDPDLASNTLILPDKAMAAKSRAFRSLSTKEETAYEEKFAKLIGA